MKRWSRNIGLVTRAQQARLTRAHVLVSGCGGMGGVCAEVLVRMGVGAITLVDHDRFEVTNSNRQIHCNQETIGRHKAEVLREQFLKINPAAKIRVFCEAVGLKNVKRILSNQDVVVNGMDEMYASICLEREARRREIPIVDAWITPFASVFTIKPTDPHWEEFLGFPTRGKPEKKISPRDCHAALKKELSYTLSHFDPYRYVKRSVVKRVVNGTRKRPSLAPVVWLSGVLMANEVFKLLIGHPDVGPTGIFFNQYEHKLVPGNLRLPRRRHG